MIFMILSLFGGSRTLCILLRYTMSIYKGKRFDETGILDIKCHTKKTKTGQFFAHAGLNAIPNPSLTVSFEVRSSAMQKQRNKQTNKNNNNNLDTFVIKKGFFMEKLSARGYNDAELSIGGLLYQF